MLPRPFWLVTIARFLLTFAVNAQATAMGIYLYQQNKNPLDLGLLGLFEAIPAISLALFAGAWVDRLPSVGVYNAVITVSALSIWISKLAGTTSLPLLPTLLFSSVVTGLARSFYFPTIQTMIPRFVERHQLRKASAWSTFSNRFGMVIGPAAGGFLVAGLGYSTTLDISLSAVVIAFVCALFLPRLTPSQVQPQEPVLQSLTLGLKFVLNHSILFPALALDMFAVLFGGVVAILPAFAEEILLSDGTGLGFLRAAPALGATLMGLFLTRRPPNKNAGKILFQVMAAYGICILFFASSKTLWAACFFLFMSGIFDSVNMVIRNALVQLASPDEYRGRIASVNSMFIGSSNEIGAFESGLAAKMMGLVPSIYFGGLMTLTTVAMIYSKFKNLREISLSHLEKSVPTKSPTKSDQ